MNNDNVIKVELRLNNSIFKCALDEKFHNLKNSKPYGVAGLNDILLGNNGATQMRMGVLLICESCWKKNKDNKEGLDLQEPSKIITTNNMPKNPKIMN